MVIGIRVRDGWLHMRMCMGIDRHDLKDIQRVLVDQRHHAASLLAVFVLAQVIPVRPGILDKTGTLGCGWDATVQNDFLTVVPTSLPHTSTARGPCGA
jgi:hypothetical protein